MPQKTYVNEEFGKLLTEHLKKIGASFETIYKQLSSVVGGSVNTLKVDILGYRKGRLLGQAFCIPTRSPLTLRDRIEKLFDILWALGVEKENPMIGEVRKTTGVSKEDLPYPPDPEIERIPLCERISMISEKRLHWKRYGEMGIYTIGVVLRDGLDDPKTAKKVKEVFENCFDSFIRLDTVSKATEMFSSIDQFSLVQSAFGYIDGKAGVIRLYRTNRLKKEWLNIEIRARREDDMAIRDRIIEELYK